ncbi:hypothetical protein FRC12_003240 [Ceratobasidium sp. 428]|nr:hypothetical protein FRC12_003240 [Ceratobasidium sp. 428]
MAHLNSGNQWGITVSRYLAIEPDGRLSEQLRKLPNQSIRRSPQLSVGDFIARTKRHISLPVLLDMLPSLTQSPQHLDKFINIGIIPACMRLMRRYALGNDKYFDRIYGLLCLDILSITLQIGMLGHYQRLAQLVEHMKTQGTTGSKIVLTIEDQTSRAIHDALHAEDSLGKLDLIVTGVAGFRTCLPLCGGFTIDNALYILELLWEDRMAFLVVGTSHLSPRYFAILFVIWRSMVYAQTDSGTAWKQLRELVYRYYLFSPPSEDSSLHMISADFETRIQQHSIETLDPQDSRKIINRYIHQLTLALQSSKLPPIKFATHFHIFAFHHANETVQDLIPELIQVSMARLWAEFDNPSPLRPKFEWVVRYATQVFKRTGSLQQDITIEEHRLAFLQALAEQDFVNLATRSLFLSTTDGIGTGYSPSPSVLDSIDSPGEFADIWFDLVTSIDSLHYKGGSSWILNNDFQSMHSDFIKAISYQETISSCFKDESFEQNHLAWRFFSYGALIRILGWSREWSVFIEVPHLYAPIA